MQGFWKDWRADVRHRGELRYKQHTDRITLRVTLASTIIALLAAGAAFWSGYEAHKARVDDERPFLAVDIAPSSEHPSREGRPVTTTLAAFGKSPARNITVNCITFSSYDIDVQWPSSPLPGNSHFPFLFPSRSTEINCPVPDIGRDTNRSHSPSKLYTEFGLVQYSGDRDEKYQTPFCVTTLFKDDGSAPTVKLCDHDYKLPDLR
jgi:hypothetical protein